MQSKRKNLAASFLSKPTPESQKAIAALEHVFDKFGADTAERTFAAALSDRFRKEWQRSHKVTEHRGRPCVQKILGRKCGLPRKDCECRPPGTDHPTLWSKAGRPIFYVSQPYALDMATIENMNEFCKKHDLEYRILSKGAFYFPSAALLVIFEKLSDSRRES